VTKTSCRNKNPVTPMQRPARILCMHFCVCIPIGVNPAANACSRQSVGTPEKEPSQRQQRQQQQQQQQQWRHQHGWPGAITFRPPYRSVDVPTGDGAVRDVERDGGRLTKVATTANTTMNSERDIGRLNSSINRRHSVATSTATTPPAMATQHLQHQLMPAALHQ
jgi:hypothetical protein